MPKVPDSVHIPSKIKEPQSSSIPIETYECEKDGKKFKVMKFAPAPGAAMRISKIVWQDWPHVKHHHSKATRRY